MPKYTNTKSGETREMSDTAYKALSPGMRALWKLDSVIADAVASTAKSIPPAGVTVNSNSGKAAEAAEVLTEAFAEVGVAFNPDGDILDHAIAAAGALRQGKAALSAAKTAEGNSVTKEPAKGDEEPEAKKTEELKPKTFEEMNATELKAELDKRGVPYKGNASKAQLLEQLQNAD